MGGDGGCEEGWKSYLGIVCDHGDVMFIALCLLKNVFSFQRVFRCNKR